MNKIIGVYPQKDIIEIAKRYFLYIDKKNNTYYNEYDSKLYSTEESQRILENFFKENRGMLK